MCNGFEIELGLSYFVMTITGYTLNNDKYIEKKREYLKQIDGYHTPLRNNGSIIGMCGRHSASYNACVLSHEFMHCLFDQDFDHDTSVKFENISIPPHSIDGMGGSRISLSKDEISARYDNIDDVRGCEE